MAGIDNLKTRIASATPATAFEILKDVNALASEDISEQSRREMIIRILDNREAFNSVSNIVDALVRQSGLFPYLRDEDLEFAALLSREAHRPEALPSLVFHEAQAHVYRQLDAGRSVILSAPTSFGKSLIVDAIIASGRFREIVLIVPTIALIDEVRRRVAKYADYLLITHSSQKRGDRNLYVLTQERLLSFEPMPHPDFFMIDEFYKLNGGDDDRSALLNLAAYRLFKSGAQFYLCGPNISSLSSLLPPEVQATFFSTDFSTVAVDTVHVPASNDDQRRVELVRLLSSDVHPALIYTQSPARANRVAKWILDSDVATTPGMGALADYLEAEYHPEWIVPAALRRGIGIHHGQLPRWLAQELVSGFNSGALSSLVCTSTLIEGVNTKARSVFILDKNIARSAYDYFTFANIRGRAGRMFEHFVGRVYLFHTPPANVAVDVDIPALSQSTDLRPDVLLGIEPDDLKPSSADRLREITATSALSPETLRANVGIALEEQENLASALLKLSPSIRNRLLWSSAYPKYDNLKATLDILWDNFSPRGASSHGPFSASQLTFFSFQMSQSGGNVAELIRLLTADGEHSQSPDDAVARAVGFTRFWLEHNLPARLRAFARIAGDVWSTDTINYSGFAARAEAIFSRQHFSTLEEYGIPLQLSRKIGRYIPASDDLNDVLSAIRRLPVHAANDLSKFEREILSRAVV